MFRTSSYEMLTFVYQDDHAHGPLVGSAELSGNGGKWQALVSNEDCTCREVGRFETREAALVAIGVELGRAIPVPFG